MIQSFTDTIERNDMTIPLEVSFERTYTAGGAPYPLELVSVVHEGHDWLSAGHLRPNEISDLKREAGKFYIPSPKEAVVLPDDPHTPLLLVEVDGQITRADRTLIHLCLAVAGGSFVPTLHGLRNIFDRALDDLSMSPARRDEVHDLYMRLRDMGDSDIEKEFRK